MKIIFLDIDGVLNYSGSNILDAHCINNLKHIVKYTGARIVLISTWKVCLDQKEIDKASDKEREELLKLKHTLDTSFKDELKILDITKDYFENRITHEKQCISLADIENCTEHSDWRSVEIRNWLKDKQIESFVIIDDFNCKYDTNYPNNWIRTSYYDRGLTAELAEQAIKILNR